MITLKWYYIVLLVLSCNLIGALNFAKIYAKIAKLDIKKGSGNPGTMNMIRTGGVLIGTITFISDVLKGFIPIFIIKHYFGNEMAVFCAMFLIIGHIYPVYYKFKGGKGVACGIGLFFAISPIVTAIAVVCLIAYLFVFHYGFIGSLLFVFSLCLYNAIASKSIFVAVVMTLLFLLICFTHRKNIVRFFKGEENKLNLTEIIKTQKQKRANHATIEGTVDSKINDIKSTENGESSSANNESEDSADNENNESTENSADSESTVKSKSTEDSKINDIKSASDNGANNGSAANNANSVSEDSKSASDNGANNGSK
ncbi:MAG: glycerol-3-phosphate acyltransferase [Clostridia bacterium]